MTNSSSPYKAEVNLMGGEYEHCTSEKILIHSD